MLKIMQSYGEIVVCIGSSASAANVDIFLQADCSIAIEPLYPQVRFQIDSLLVDPMTVIEFFVSLGLPKYSSLYGIEYSQ